MALTVRLHDMQEDECLTILEASPARRNIFLDPSNFYGYNGDVYDKYGKYGDNVANVPFPYIVFVFHYHPVPGGFCYSGIYGRNVVRDYNFITPGLRVLFSANPVESLNDNVYPAITEHHSGGASCTDHSWDKQVFKDHRLLVGTILELWWSNRHNLCGGPASRGSFWKDKPPECSLVEFWTKMTVEDMLSSSWYVSDPNFKKRTLKEIIPDSFKECSLINESAGILPSRLSKGIVYK